MENELQEYKLLKTKIKELLDIQKSLSTFFVNKRKFTLDGRLVGDIGEIIVEMHYDITLDTISKKMFDGEDSKGRKIQIKATMQDALTFKTTQGHFIGIKINKDGSYEEIYNGPAKNIYDHYSHRKGIGETLLRFNNETLLGLSKKIHIEDRISKK